MGERTSRRGQRHRWLPGILMAMVALLLLVVTSADIATAEADTDDAGGAHHADRHARLAGTPIAWPAGVYRLGDMIDQLNASGNPTRLSLGTDAEREAELPAFNGRYWQAVRVLCDAYGLAPNTPATTVPASSASRWLTDAYVQDVIEGNALRLPVVPAIGPVVLEPATGALPDWLVIGSLLVHLREPIVTVERRASGEQRWLSTWCRFRLEPGITAGSIQSMSIRWDAVTGAPGVRLADVGERPPRPDAGFIADVMANDPWTIADQGWTAPAMGERIVLIGVPSGSATLTVSGNIQARLVAPMQASLRLSVDQPQTISMGDVSIVVSYRMASGLAAVDGDAPLRYGVVEVQVPLDVALTQAPTIEVLSTAYLEVPDAGSHEYQTDSHYVYRRIIGGLPEPAVMVDIAGTLERDAQSLLIQLPVSVP